MTYNELTLQHFATARHAGELHGAGTRRGTAGGHAQGTWVQFDLQAVAPAAGGAAVVRAAKFLAYACPHVIAVSDWLSEQAIGREVRGGLPVGIHVLQQRFGVPIDKLGRLLIVEDAWIAASAPPYETSWI